MRQVKDSDVKPLRISLPDTWVDSAFASILIAWPSDGKKIHRSRRVMRNNDCFIVVCTKVKESSFNDKTDGGERFSKR